MPAEDFAAPNIRDELDQANVLGFDEGFP
jgi:hypothetical protein